MLDVKDIVNFKLDRARLNAHIEMPVPKYVRTPLIGQFTALSDAILTELLGVSPDKFKTQLGAARALGAGYVLNTGNEIMGVSAVTSLIKGGRVLTKNVIVPTDFLYFDPSLAKHIIIGAFVRGQVTDGQLAYDQDISVAGWTTTYDIECFRAAGPPATFVSRLEVAVLPCHALKPVETLFQFINQAR